MPNQSDPTQPVINPPAPADTSPAIPDFQTADIPPIPADNSQAPVVNDQPESSPDLPPIISPPPKKKFGGGKIIATILGFLILVGGLGTGIVLVKQQQDIREKAADKATCNETGACGGCGEAQQECANKEGCKWQKTGTTKVCSESAPCGVIGGPNCTVITCSGKCVSSGGPTPTATPTSTPTSTPTPTPTSPGVLGECIGVKAYNKNWKPIDPESNTLKEGDVIYFAIQGKGGSEKYDKAQFKIKNVQLPVILDKKPGFGFYHVYVILKADIGRSITTKARIHHEDWGWSETIGWTEDWPED